MGGSICAKARGVVVLTGAQAVTAAGAPVSTEVEGRVLLAVGAEEEQAGIEVEVPAWTRVETSAVVEAEAVQA